MLKTLFLKGGFYLINKVEISSVNTSQLPILTNKEKEELFIRIKQGKCKNRIYKRKFKISIKCYTKILWKRRMCR